MRVDSLELLFRYVDRLYERVQAFMRVSEICHLPTNQLLAFSSREVYNLFDQMIAASQIRDTN
ncbi:hypothetical protein RvY_06307 [Ramazzottius varieornatus]|uniref:Uncharacterized protein n=1 Tax=Ramazzottius varieornatus TaxID=947166 RepID=A0A1D1V3K7_RAMVA|nr:hypothetical protein RvY_06307 [Ramazzottius varieornatus]